MQEYFKNAGQIYVEWDYDSAKNPTVDKFELGMFSDPALAQQFGTILIGGSDRLYTTALSAGVRYLAMRAIISSTGISSDWSAPCKLTVIAQANPAPNPKPDSPTNVRVG
jgi:hypothetical protein